MPFVDWNPLVRAAFFGAVFLLPLFAVLWLWYDSSGRQDAARWYWRLVLSVLVLLTTPAVVLGAANLDSSQQDLLRIFGFLAIAAGVVALIGVIAYAVWGRAPSSDAFDEDVAAYPEADAVTLTAPPTITAPAPPTVAAPARAAGQSSATGAYLFAKSGPDQGRQFPLADLVTIGRSPSCGISLADPRVSSEHAQLKRDGASYVYLDLKSTNGSFLLVEGREERLRAAQALVDGDEIRLGQTVVQFIQVPQGGQR